MAVDPGMVDTILGTFRGMARELKEAGNDSDDARECFSALETMERLALEMDDLGAYSTKLSVDGLFTDFSTAYGRALASNSSVDGDSSDDQLMANTLKSYEDALNDLKSKPSAAHLVPVLQEVVDKGKSGLSYPLFLKECEEKGLFLGLDSPRVGPTIQYDIYCARISFRPVDRELYERQLEAYQDLVNRSAFGYPDPVEWEITRQKLEWEYEPRQILWKAIEDRWDRMLDMVQDWVDSFCSFAPHDERWCGMGGVNSRAQTMKNIQRTQECEPGMLQVREEIFQEYFDLSWNDIFIHPTFLNQQENGLLWYSDQAIDFIREVHEIMHPGARPDSDMISRAEKQHNSKAYVRQDRATAEAMTPMPFPEFLNTIEWA
ncbi:MAG TPA: hypothetical protein DEA96_17765 [Leptospiraceae bacterium]|nr:hypothetical protein [Spirochaetaceae bacterium]HBS06822.1 hypothetical protein [Leptospiraceae bacterium]|tara:strand:+ start:3235 stop:4362 length:1128 start_codon:yes stop_codon:yes gene_type:complete